MTPRIAVAFTVLLATPGCLHRGQVKDRPLEVPPGYHAQGAKKAAAVKKGRWWAVFADRELDGLITRALRDNLSLASARARIAQSAALLKTARAGYWPSLSLAGRVGRSRRGVPARDGIAIPAQGAIPALNFPDTPATAIQSNTIDLSLAASYEIDFWGKVRYAAKAAELDTKASADDLRAAHITVTAQVADAYFVAVEMRAQLALLDQTIKSRESNHALVRRRYREGLVSALDLYQARGNLAQAKSRRETFASRLATTGNALAALVGRFPGQIDPGKLDQLPGAVAEMPTGLPADLLLRRPDIRAAHARLAAADARVGQAIAAHYPTLKLSASIGGSLDPTAWIYNLLANLTAPLFNGGAISAQVARNEAVLQLALVAYKTALIGAVREVDDALVSGRRLEAQVKHLDERVKAAVGALRLSTDQYTQGIITYLPVLTAEQSVYNARSELIAVRRSLVSSRIQLARALGGSWMDKKRDDNV